VLNGDREKLAQALSAYKKTLDKLSLVTSAQASQSNTRNLLRWEAANRSLPPLLPQRV
jgi:hypothetical protein